MNALRVKPRGILRLKEPIMSDSLKICAGLSPAKLKNCEGLAAQCENKDADGNYALRAEVGEPFTFSNQDACFTYAKILAGRGAKPAAVENSAQQNSLPEVAPVPVAQNVNIPDGGEIDPQLEAMLATQQSPDFQTEMRRVVGCGYFQTYGRQDAYRIDESGVGHYYWDNNNDGVTDAYKEIEKDGRVSKLIKGTQTSQRADFNKVRKCAFDQHLPKMKEAAIYAFSKGQMEDSEFYGKLTVSYVGEDGIRYYVSGKEIGGKIKVDAIKIEGPDGENLLMVIPSRLNNNKIFAEEVQEAAELLEEYCK